MSAYRVESKPPELVKEGIVAPEARSRRVGVLGQENSDDLRNNVDSKADTSSSFGADGLANCDTKNHGQDVAHVGNGI